MANKNPSKSFNKIPKEEARKIQSKGGHASTKVRRERKAIRENLEILLALPVKNPTLKKKIKSLGIDDEDLSNQMAISISLFNEALHGNTKAFELIRDTIGEKPIDKQEIKEITTEWFK